MSDKTGEISNTAKVTKNIKGVNQDQKHQKSESRDVNRESREVKLEDLQKELELLKKKNEEYLNGWKRAKADYINFKRETEKRQAEIIQFASAAIILEVLQIYNHFKMALKHLPKDHQDQEWAKGLVQIKKQYIDFFRQVGIEEIKTVGEKFNPEFHEAVSYEPKEGFKTDIIFEEVKPGYKLHDKVIEPAKVKVAK